jgi:hypothetical protein
MRLQLMRYGCDLAKNFPSDPEPVFDDKAPFNTATTAAIPNISSPGPLPSLAQSYKA